MPVDIANLSSNWKKLQEKLKDEKTRKPAKSKLHEKNGLANGYTNTSHSKQHLKRKFTTTQNPTSKRPKPSPTTAKMSITSKSHTLPDNPTKQAAISATSTPPKQVTPGKHIALDTEMVGTYSAPLHSLPPNRQPPHTYSILARVSLVTYDLEPLYDAYVLPPPNTPIADYRTPFSGITAWHLNPSNPTTRPKNFDVVQKEVADLLDGRVLIGHDLSGDLAVLGLSHPRSKIRDTATLPKFRALANGVTAGPGASRREGGVGAKNSAANVKAREQGRWMMGWRKPGLRMLALELLGWEIQKGEKGHDSVEDARATMAVFKKERKEFEREAGRRFGVRNASGGTGKDEGGAKGAEGKSGELRGKDEAPDGAAVDGEGADTEGDSVSESDGAGMNDRSQATGTRKKRRKKKKKGKYR